MFSNSHLFGEINPDLVTILIYIYYIYIPIPSMGLVHLVDFYAFHVGKYTSSPMDASWDK